MDSSYDDIWSPISRVYDPVANGSIDGTDTEPHDRAIVRALNSKYKPNAKVTGDPRCTIFIARLNHATDELTLKQIFSKYGQIKQLRLVRDIITGASKGYAFIEYYDASVVDRVYQDAHSMNIDDKEILVDYICARVMPGWIPRRLGGGFGGQKESGQLRFGCRDRPFRKPIFLSTDDYQAGVRHSKVFGRYGQNSDNLPSNKTRSPERLHGNRDERSRPESRRGEDRSRQYSSEDSDEDRTSRKRRKTKYRVERTEREKLVKIEVDGDAKLPGISSSFNDLSSKKLSGASDLGANVKHEVE